MNCFLGIEKPAARLVVYKPGGRASAVGKRFRLYEKYCSEANAMPYWGGESDDEEVPDYIVAADPTNEPDCEDCF